MRIRVMLTAAVCLAVSFTATGEDAPASHVLARAGATDFVIVVDADAIPTEQTAARELKVHLDAVTGADFPIQEAAESAGPCLYVGSGRRFHDVVPDADQLGPDGIRILSKDGDIYFGGDRPRGALYAVFTFLEDTVGCHWWTPTESEIPDEPNLTVPVQDVAYTPPIKVREAFYYLAFDPLYGARNRLNGHFQRIPEDYGGHHRIIGWCHTFFQFMPPAKYFGEHPEWFSMIDGERVNDGQLCLTNEAMRAEFIRQVLERIKNDPSAGIISVSQNDWRRPCECPECKALVEREGSEAGPVIDFVNEVAEAVEKDYPDFLVMTLAYSYTRHAPRHVKPRENVAIRLCSIECDFSKPLATGPRNASFAQDIEDWSAIAHHLYIWNYVTNFAQFLLPQPNWDGFAPDLKLFVDHKAIGVFEQGDRRSTCGDFYALRPWVMSKLLWNPNQDADALIHTFLDGYYGPAGKALWQYIQVTRKAVGEADIDLGCFRRTTEDWLGLDDLNRITELFDEAGAAVVGNDVYERRLAVARMPIDYVWLRRYKGLSGEAASAGKTFLGPKDPAAARDTFMNKIAEYDCAEFGENHYWEQALPGFARMFEDVGPLPENLAGREPGKFIYRPARNLQVLGGAETAALVRDDAAADGLALRIQPFAEKQAVRCPGDPEMAAFAGRDYYVLLRVEAVAESGPACEVGMLETRSNPKERARTVVNIEDLDPDGYTAVRIPSDSMRMDRYFFVDTLNNPEAVSAVRVAGFFME